ncbi:MAG: chemotaxis protein CheD [Clostridia bacterium]|nr:chemotaxis protein CheD [Clostridia bacterium]
MEQEIKVGIAEWQVAKSPVRLVTLGLGSCVGVTLYDAMAKVGGLAHIMLPDSKQFQHVDNVGKYADTALPRIVKDLQKLGASLTRLRAKLAGGAQMFRSSNQGSLLRIGERNVEMCRLVLSQLGIPVVAEDVGGNHGRTIILYTDSGNLLVRSLGFPPRVI